MIAGGVVAAMIAVALLLLILRKRKQGGKPGPVAEQRIPAPVQPQAGPAAPVQPQTWSPAPVQPVSPPPPPDPNYQGVIQEDAPTLGQYQEQYSPVPERPEERKY